MNPSLASLSATVTEPVELLLLDLTVYTTVAVAGIKRMQVQGMICEHHHPSVVKCLPCVNYE